MSAQRWNEARTLWGGVINTCRNVVRQSNTFFPDDAMHNGLKRRMAAETSAFIYALRNFLRGRADDDPNPYPHPIPTPHPTPIPIPNPYPYP